MAATRQLAAGSYLAEVSAGDPTVNSGFTLVLDPDALVPQVPGTDPGQSLATALNLSVLASSTACGGSLDVTTNPSDHFQFTLDADQSLSIRLGGVIQPALVELFCRRPPRGRCASHNNWTPTLIPAACGSATSALAT